MANLNFSTTVFEKWIAGFAKTVTHTPVTKTTSNLDGEETLTLGTAISISGAFFKSNDAYVQSKPGLLKNADAVLLVLPSVTISKEDLISFNSESFRAMEVEPRYLGATQIYNVVRLFLVE